MIVVVLCLLLGHPVFAVREAAAESLLCFGPFAIPALTIAALSDDPHVRFTAGLLAIEAGAGLAPESLPDPMEEPDG